MKKAFSTLMMLVAVVAFAVACKKNDDSGGGSNYAATPTVAPTQNCVNPATPGCTPAQPNFYQQNAPQFINYQWGYANGFCGCPTGYRPVMNQSWGMSCAPYSWFPNGFYYSSYATFDIQSNWYGPQNGQWTSIPQVTYSPATSGNTTSCGAVASVICDTRNPATCTNGSTCRQVGGGTYLGLCSNGVGNESYQNPTPQNGCAVYNGYGWVNVCSGGNSGYYYYGVSGSLNSTLLPR